MLIYGKSPTELQIMQSQKTRPIVINVGKWIVTNPENNDETTKTIAIGLSNGTLLTCWIEMKNRHDIGTWRFAIKEQSPHCKYMSIDAGCMSDLIGCCGIPDNTDVIVIENPDEIRWISTGTVDITPIPKRPDDIDEHCESKNFNKGQFIGGYKPRHKTDSISSRKNRNCLKRVLHHDFCTMTVQYLDKEKVIKALYDDDGKECPYEYARGLKDRVERGKFDAKVPEALVTQMHIKDAEIARLKKELDIKKIHEGVPPVPEPCEIEGDPCICMGSPCKRMKEHDRAIAQAAEKRGYDRALDEFGILHGEDAQKFMDELKHPSPLTPEAAELVKRPREIAAKEHNP